MTQMGKNKTLSASLRAQAKQSRKKATLLILTVYQPPFFDYVADYAQSKRARCLHHGQPQEWNALYRRDI